ncbi:hypothetical protein EBM89_00665 [Cellulomonas triticagri]|uniref:Uncharacterized protein n=1 Tax=Cellulomonas triticagri TaxID=2483352 RepID=A0A3M2JW61_9CELL|nr:hypothetical protein EBM89_00665 [Cellulomonas triticagri]
MLRVGASEGMWRIGSAGSTYYLLDLDRVAVVRVRGVGSGRFPFDGQWSHLLEVSSWDLGSGVPEPDIVRVGCRPRYTFDPHPTWPDEEWRWQRVVTSICRITREDAAALRAQFAAGEEGERRSTAEGEPMPD